jgi:nicotinate dehydrogenase subunit B
MKPSASSATLRTSLDATQPASWIEVHADDTVLIRTGKCDFGQSSIYTAYRQIVAEELGVSFDAITTVMSGDTDRTPDGGGTFGLLRTNVLNLRKAAAYTREAVLELVAGQDLRLTIPVGGELTSFFGIQVLGNPPLKPASAYTIVGKPHKNSIVRPKISGETVWVGDVKLPGMLHARVVHPVTLGSKLVAAGKVDKGRFPGAQVVVIGNLVAVVSASE